MTETTTRSRVYRYGKLYMVTNNFNIPIPFPGLLVLLCGKPILLSTIEPSRFPGVYRPLGFPSSVKKKKKT